MGVLEEIHKLGNTIILVTHEEDIARHAHRIIRLMDGQIADDYMNTDIITVGKREKVLEESGK
jgi:putative ABC transport system ATP-binding protein